MGTICMYSYGERNKYEINNWNFGSRIHFQCIYFSYMEDDIKFGVFVFGKSS